MLCVRFMDLERPHHICKDISKISKKHLEPISEAKYVVTDKNWQEFIGRPDSYASYLKYFDQQVSEQGHIATLKKYLPQLIPGLAGAALHPLIHLGYSVEFNLPLAAAEGLAYACSSYYAPGEAIDEVVAKESAKDSCLQLITQFPFEKSKYENEGKKGSALLTKMGGFIKKHGVDLVNLCSDWACTVDNVSEKTQDLTLGTVKIFDGSYRQGTMDFFLVHALTGNHSVCALMEILDAKDQVRLLNLNFMALTILYAVQGVPSIHIDSSNNMVYEGLSTSWEELAARASESDDSHVIKAVRNLHQSEVKYGKMHGIFHRPAARCIKDVLKNGWCFMGIGFLPDN
ncbi:hypothetical protein DSO57_1003185 [Entomophthora muscae]|uniref:Uncharacterized protein n=1 Tax=Entomophthora muscae TaxID=34485 RepID=A0ACC2SAK4_9FUNG|nr:hypothetical protein DSO57_1003185 [Entomophthora muscae]